MSEFSTQVNIDALADDVFSYVTDFNRMPEYLPTLKRATPAGDGQIRMEGEVEGRSYNATGWFQTHEFNRTMLWGAKSASDYSGDLEVVDQGDHCMLTINLKYEALPDMSEAERAKLEAHSSKIQKGLEEAAQQIKRSCESLVVKSDDRSHGYMG